MKTVIRDRSAPLCLFARWLTVTSRLSLTAVACCSVFTDWAGHSWPLCTVLVYSCTVQYYCAVTSTMRSWHNYMIMPKNKDPEDVLKTRLHSVSKVHVQKSHNYATSCYYQLWSLEVPNLQTPDPDMLMKSWSSRFLESAQINFFIYILGS